MRRQFPQLLPPIYSSTKAPTLSVISTKRTLPSLSPPNIFSRFLFVSALLSMDCGVEMQRSPVLGLSPSFNSYNSGRLAEIAARIIEELGESEFQTEIEAGNDLEESIHSLQVKEGDEESALFSEVKSGNDDEDVKEDEVDGDGDGDDDSEFAFVWREPETSPISADEIFYNGQIRPVFPIFNRDLLLGEGQNQEVSVKPPTPASIRRPLRKLLIEERGTGSCSSSEADELEGVPPGTYCVWTPKAAESPPARCRKSNSTGSSKRWKFRDFLHRSNSEENHGDKSVLSIRKFSHTWKQNSIIARFEGYDPDKSNDVVIVGAHQDSIHMWLPTFGRAPGADDDGSGTVTILEAFRVLVTGGFKPQRPVEFHWYSAEEAGLLGSQAISLEYEKQGRNVIGMIQNDMTGYIGSRSAEHIGIVNDYVDEDLTKFVTKLIGSYVDIPFSLTKCGYACSDHASWRKAGFPSAFAIEGDFGDSNPHIHSPNDLTKYISYDHMLQFSKLSVSFAVELSHA